MYQKFFSTKTEYDEWLNDNYKIYITYISTTEHGILITYIDDKKELNKNKRRRLWKK